MRTNVIAGNWKMNKTNAEAVEMLTELKGLVKDVEGVKRKKIRLKVELLDHVKI